MDSYQRYDSIRHIQEMLISSPTALSFLKNHQEELVTLLDIPSLGTQKHTKKSLFALLDLEHHKLTFEIQSQYLRAGLDDKKILPLKSALEWKRKEEVAKINSLPMILQLACSHPEYYFRKNFEHEISRDELIDYVVVDPNMLPQGFLNAFQIESIDIEGKNIKKLFKRAQPLHYHKDKDVITWRVVFIDGKLVVFRELHQLLHQEDRLTQGEKRRVDYKKYFNTFDNVYTALRSQQYIVDKEDDKINDYKNVQKQMIDLIQEISFATKHGDEKRQLDQIIQDIKGATSFYVMASKFYNLFKIDFFNKRIAANQVVGAHNKIAKELYRFRNIILEIQLQSDALEQLLYIQEHAFLMLFSQVSQCVTHADTVGLTSAFQQYYTQVGSFPQKTEPFITFEQEIKSLFGSMIIPKNMTSAKSVLKADILLTLQKNYLQLYQLEHAIKLGTVNKHDFSFVLNISQKYPELYKDFFAAIDQYLLSIQQYGDQALTKETMDACLSLLQQAKNLPDWKDNVSALQQF